ncbi:Choline-sulfatase [Pseudoruegeria aquimaris]|uniref:Choline-sulfatase n=1 Tax=Pseudoruegeria aquimaris TaxID=393663 RepID=A0A1Y5RGR1_9RHOB|nr:choline-sulfatase [Pseudoruegeria aquimaris]SLN16808.1 Choline-sulfatase [Pseudoruegeria aquimaris]
MTAPNILIFMVDQLAGTFFPDGPADWLHTPNLKRLAARSARFSNAYTASPLCGPARASFMTGCLPSRTGVYDNAAEFAPDMPTFAHHLRSSGYQTCLAGKMHFVGPDQLHGFEERLTSDIYPADYGWTPDYRKPGERIDWWYHNMGSVTGAGVAEITNQLEYDDEVAARAKAKVYDLARGKDARPWCLTVSFTHPHDPYVARRKYWDLYEDCAHLMPEVPPIPFAEQDAQSRRIFEANDFENYTITETDVQRSRRAYFANISYIDEKIGEVMEALQATRQEAVILFTSDHGDMLGERGLWFKMSFLEGSARVPLMIAGADTGPGIAPGRHEAPVSLLDVAPTLCEIAGVPAEEIAPWCEGESLLPLTRGAERTAPVRMEYAAESSQAPLVCLRYGKWKYIRCALDPDLLYDLEADPHELENLAEHPAHQGTLAALRAKADARWDLAAFDAEVRASQARRWVVYDALRKGRYTPWEYTPPHDDTRRFMRNHMNLNTLEEEARFPRGE